MQANGINVTDSKRYDHLFPASVSSHIRGLHKAMDAYSSLPYLTLSEDIKEEPQDSADAAHGLVSAAQDIVDKALRINATNELEAKWHTFWETNAYQALTGDNQLSHL